MTCPLETDRGRYVEHVAGWYREQGGLVCSRCRSVILHACTDRLPGYAPFEIGLIVYVSEASHPRHLTIAPVPRHAKPCKWVLG